MIKKKIEIPTGQSYFRETGIQPYAEVGNQHESWIPGLPGPGSSRT